MKNKIDSKIKESSQFMHISSKFISLVLLFGIEEKGRALVQSSFRQVVTSGLWNSCVATSSTS